MSGMNNEQNQKNLENNNDFFYLFLTVSTKLVFWKLKFNNMELVSWKICLRRYKVNLQEKLPKYTKYLTIQIPKAMQIPKA